MLYKLVYCLQSQQKYHKLYGSLKSWFDCPKLPAAERVNELELLC